MWHSRNLHETEWDSAGQNQQDKSTWRLSEQYNLQTQRTIGDFSFSMYGELRVKGGRMFVHVSSLTRDRDVDVGYRQSC